MKRKPVVNQGFALVVTLSLLILLTVVAVGLLTLSSIALRSSGHGNDMATARANARLAMMLALGDLQKYAGPDQRVTARADIASGASNPLYTGIWNSKPDPLLPNAPLDKTAPLAWLVSGNKATGLATAPVVSAANGGVAVTAPLQEVKSTAASTATGAFAYWVSDEGVKARINLDSPGFRTSATVTDAARAFAGSPRAAIELMETAASPPTGTVSSAWGTTLYPYVAETAPKLITSGQLPLYAAAGSQTTARTATKARFHDLTAYSSSVLSNTADGGLRQDLTRILADPTKGPADTDPIFPAADPSPNPAPTEIQCLPPTWGRLRYWWNHPVDPATGSITPALRTSTTPSIAPVLMWVELGLAFYVENASPTYRIRIQQFPRAIIWNPYNVPMTSGTYELGISSWVPYNTDPVVRSVIIESRPLPTLPATAPTYVGTYDISVHRLTGPATNMPFATLLAATRYIRFTVDVPRLEPGQARVFSLPSSGGTTLQDGDNPGNYTVPNASTGDWLETAVPPPYQLKIPRPNVDPYVSGLNPFYLRASGEADPGPVDFSKLPGKIFQWARTSITQPGFTGASSPLSPLSLAQAGIPAIQPDFRVLSFATMNNPNAWIRWMANSNQLATVQANSYGFPFSTNRAAVASASSTMLPTTASGDVSISTGLSSAINSSGQAYRLTLREPRLSDPGLYQSIAQLQHTPLNDSAPVPLNAVGNSLQNPRISNRTATFINGGDPLDSPLYDSSYLLNQALWDKYFFSTVPSSLADADLAAPGYQLPNARLRPLATASSASLKTYNTAAANLILLGGFNVNSTSEQAWRAVLGTAHHLKYDPFMGALAPTKPLLSPYSRFLRPRGNSAEPYRGYRQLTEAQTAALAAAMVAEVKKRGPFRSLSDFVNRRLVASTDNTSATGLMGPVQAAIDAVDRGANQINKYPPYTLNITHTYGTGGATDNEAWVGVPKEIDPDTSHGTAPMSSLNAFGPGYLTQADVLSRIGSAISARSDTFVIRTCGEARNGNTVTAKAYCEAVVQRTPDYVEPSSIAPEAIPATGSINERFGRRFTIVSFRWLSSNEI